MSDTYRQQKAVFALALGVMHDREEVYGGLWATTDAQDMANHARSKILRAHRLANAEPGNVPKEVLNDSILDGINYLAFLYRHANGMLPPVPPVREED